MIVYHSSWQFLVSCFPRKSAGSSKRAAKSSSRGSVAASERRVYIQDDNHDKETSEDQDNIKMSSEESVNSQELEETLEKKKRITKRSS